MWHGDINLQETAAWCLAARKGAARGQLGARAGGGGGGRKAGCRHTHTRTPACIHSARCPSLQLASGRRKRKEEEEEIEIEEEEAEEAEEV